MPQRSKRCICSLVSVTFASNPYNSVLMPALLVPVVLSLVSVLAVQVARIVALKPSFVVVLQALSQLQLDSISPLPLGQNQAFSELLCLKFPGFSEERHIEPLGGLRGAKDYPRLA